MVTLLNLFLPIVSLVIALLAAVGGWSAFRLNRGQQFSTIQAQTIDALKVRVETLEGQSESDAKEIQRLTEENVQLKKLLHAVRHALVRRDLIIEVDDDYVSIIDTKGQSSTQVPNTAKIRPMRLKAFDDAI